MLFNRRVIDRWPTNTALNATLSQAVKPKPLPPALTAAAPAFDYIVIGAGSAGCALVATLAQGNPTATILLVEAGPSNEVPAIHDFTQAMSLRGTIYDWNYQSQAQSCMNGQPLPYDAGRAAGGSSSINGMVWVRGNSADYDGWSALGNTGWDYQSVLPVFMRQETYSAGSSSYRGGNGPIYITPSLTNNPISTDFNTAATKFGYTLNSDYNAETQYGVAYSQLNVRPASAPVYGIRQDSFNAFVLPSLSSPQVFYVDQTMVTNITFDSQNNVSQVFLSVYGLNPIPVTCLQETILCAGALRSPQLLMLSGIGDATVLKQLGIPVVVDLPGVGQNLQDQLISFVVRPLATIDKGHFSPMCNNIFTNGLPSAASDTTAPTYEVQTFYMANNPGFPPNQYAVGAITLHPLSRGAVTLSSARYTDPPVIQPNLLCDSQDVQTSLTGLKMVREIATYFAANSSWLGAETMPGPNVTTDQELTTYMKETSVPDFHYVGTCKMGPDTDSMSVVDSQLRVKGVTGLRVADASIMPTVISGNTNACSNMIGGRCGDFILQG
jgi:choline dehydrogenase